MRLLLLALAAPLILAACDVASSTSTTQSPAGGYTLEVRAVEGVQTYIVTAPDGRRTASTAAEGTSRLLDAGQIERLGAAEPLSSEPEPEVFGLRLPGVDISVSADEDNPDGDSATVHINAGGRTVHVDAEDGGPGDDDDRANVMITGASESDARGFINDAEHLSDDVKQQMLTAVGL
ncbi:MAG: hypothetical protein KDA35_10435 [Hyphomonadaceae bacterium]|nr:hypothetical protein [Hyphomonadaceae bacterium]